MDNMIQEIHASLIKKFWESVEIDFKDEKNDWKHFYLDICSELFVWLSRVKQSQLVYETLDAYMKSWYIHALRIKCRVPDIKK
jgi:acid stress-induced BolA-like protein IbaG/YrbA